MRFTIFITVLLLVGCESDKINSTDQTTPPTSLSILPQTGQTVCYEIPLSGTTISCPGTGQDAETRAGATWPIPRFTPSGTGIARDELTGLEWTADRNAPGPAECLPGTTKTWDKALEYIKCINQNSYLGYSDWYLPNVVQLSSLLNANLAPSFSEQFLAGSWGYWWTSTTSIGFPTFALTSLAEGGYLTRASKIELNKVWPVRNGESGTIILQRTNQTTCYDSLGITIDCAGTGQDGDILAGREWPTPRFSDNGDGTIIDNLTGVIWSKNAEFPYSEVCSPGTKDFPSSVSYIQCLNDNMYLGYNDWRIPNEFEVRSLKNYANYSYDDKISWLSSYGFYNFSPYSLMWSSTVEDGLGWPVGIWVDGGHWNYDYTLGNIWPVRGNVRGQ